MNIMNHFRMSDLTTPRELMDANLDDREKLELGLESRTLCCFSVVPTDCMNGICGHGTHEPDEQWESRDAWKKTEWESREAWEKTQCRWTD